ncbi:FHA domain-containing protein [methane-oxidizing endosymbiont of Gigantopelta aegis]|uniref:FHA domain-containing protein n=1 Tax=methane-oxidizing endosymbiont of Gigantopelta aegis TaxID=2794938 RepID=UPI0018DE8BE3|nr:FHA domain-containing protein [methane-oxidizing endosymbiont of Gigantopelta aegis]
MAKFTVYFKDKALNSGIFDAGIVHIGRDETNEITVDSLSIAPVHAVVVIKESGSIIKQLSSEHPLIINGEQTEEYILANNDRIELGKHYIIYNTIETISNGFIPKSDKAENSLDKQLSENAQLPEASLQILNGPHIGRIIGLKKAITRIGNSTAGIAVISRRKDGFYVSALENPDKLEVSNQPVGEKSVKLSDNDIITRGCCRFENPP